MHHAAKATIEKHFGPDDDRRLTWTAEKRRAFGGLYRYYALTTVQQREDWTAAARWVAEALRVDESLAGDLDLFYDFALGSQPPGLRGSRTGLDLRSNAEQIELMLQAVFGTNSGAAAADLAPLANTAHGTAYFALGLVAYHLREFSFSRHLLLRALYFRPELARDRRLMANLVKSLPGRALVERFTEAGNAVESIG